MKKHKVLIVDDDVIFHMIAERHVIKGGLDTSPEVLLDGARLKEYFLEQHDSDTRYIVLLDINMPEMNGWEFLEWVCGTEFKNSLEIFIVTSSKNPNDKKMADENNLVKGFLIKPFNQKHIDDIKKTLAID